MEFVRGVLARVSSFVSFSKESSIAPEQPVEETVLNVTTIPVEETVQEVVETRRIDPHNLLVPTGRRIRMVDGQLIE